MRTRRLTAASVAAGVVGAGVVVTPMVLAANPDDAGSSDDTTMSYRSARADEDRDDNGHGWAMQNRRESWGKGQPGRREGFGMQRAGPGGVGQGMGPGQHMRGDGH